MAHQKEKKHLSSLVNRYQELYNKMQKSIATLQPKYYFITPDNKISSARNKPYEAAHKKVFFIDDNFLESESADLIRELNRIAVDTKELEKKLPRKTFLKKLPVGNYKKNSYIETVPLILTEDVTLRIEKFNSMVEISIPGAQLLLEKKYKDVANNKPLTPEQNLMKISESALLSRKDNAFILKEDDLRIEVLKNGFQIPSDKPIFLSKDIEIKFAENYYQKNDSVITCISETAGIYSISD